LTCDNATTEAIRRSTAQIYFEHDTLVFSLEGLYQYLIEQNEISFRVFKKSLYTGSLNHQLSTFGAKVDVYQSLELIETRFYCLVRLSRAAERVTIQ
jgi:hypothetical protein